SLLWTPGPFNSALSLCGVCPTSSQPTVLVVSLSQWVSSCRGRPLMACSFIRSICKPTQAVRKRSFLKE
ncbi:hypothetical protein M9458_026277, partial [Cirrhinus mrigala]